MSELAHIHDRLVQQQGYDCRCEQWNCPAMKAAIQIRNRELADEGQLQLEAPPKKPGPMTNEDWCGF